MIRVSSGQIKFSCYLSFRYSTRVSCVFAVTVNIFVSFSLFEIQQFSHQEYLYHSTLKFDH